MPKPRERAEALAGVSLASVALFAVLLRWANLQAPPRIHLFELLWAAARRPIFYLAIGLTISAVITGVLALRRRGRHRVVLIAGWIVGAAIIGAVYGPEVAAMARVIRSQM